MWPSWRWVISLWFRVLRFRLLRFRQRLTSILLAALLCSVAAAAQVQRGGLTVTYTGARDRLHLGSVFKTWETATHDLKALGLSPPVQIRIEAAASAADFAARTGEPSGIAASTRGAVIVTQRLTALALSGRLPTTIRHEAFHTAQPAGLPRWLAEGLARTFSGEAASDPGGPTGLGSLSSAALDARLMDRDPARLGPAYLEATRRAKQQIKVLGWRGAVLSSGR